MARWKLTEVVREKVASLRADIKAMCLSERQVTVRLTGSHTVDVTIRDEKVSLAQLAPLAARYAAPAQYLNRRQVNPGAFAAKVSYAIEMYAALANALSSEFRFAETGYTFELDGLFRVTKRHSFDDSVILEYAGSAHEREFVPYYHAGPVIAQMLLEARARGLVSILPQYTKPPPRINFL